MQYISQLPSPAWQAITRKKLVVLGCTGSIGQSTLAVARAHPERLQLVALAAAKNIKLLASQALEFRPPWLAVYSKAEAEALRLLLPPDYTPTVLSGADGYAFVAALEEADTILSAQAGAAGLKATLSAVRAGKVVCLANKESLVLAAGLMQQLCAASGAAILPVDSEHNAVFQAVCGRNPQAVKRLILTASGGPFRGFSPQQLAAVRPAQALCHPTWAMGAKITIDSATMMNKGLEIIEAQALYALPPEQIDVLVHPQSIIHSMVEFNDASSLAHLGTPDMRMPIAACLFYPEMVDVGVPQLNLAALGCLTFEEPDLVSFPSLRLARLAMREQKGLPVVLNAANEVAVEAFLQEKIAFTDIFTVVEKAMNQHKGEQPENYEAITALDAASRHYAKTVLHG